MPFPAPPARLSACRPSHVSLWLSYALQEGVILNMHMIKGTLTVRLSPSWHAWPHDLRIRFVHAMTCLADMGHFAMTLARDHTTGFTISRMIGETLH